MPFDTYTAFCEGAKRVGGRVPTEEDAIRHIHAAPEKLRDARNYARVAGYRWAIDQVRKDKANDHRKIRRASILRELTEQAAALKEAEQALTQCPHLSARDKEVFRLIHVHLQHFADILPCFPNSTLEGLYQVRSRTMRHLTDCTLSTRSATALQQLRHASGTRKPQGQLVVNDKYKGAWWSSLHELDDVPPLILQMAEVRHDVPAPNATCELLYAWCRLTPDWPRAGRPLPLFLRKGAFPPQFINNKGNKPWQLHTIPSSSPTATPSRRS